MPTILRERDMVFSFDDGWEVEPFDTWPEYKKLNTAPFDAKGCDFVAHDGHTLWLIEAKDYTYQGVTPPDDLAHEVARKTFDTLATLRAVACWGAGEHRTFSRAALACADITVCLTMELPDRGRKLLGVETQLTHFRDELSKVTRLLGCHRPLVTASHMTKDPRFSHLYPWQASRDPAARPRHHDR